MGALTSLIQASGAAGELSPAVRGRVDLAKYRAGFALMRNWFTQPYGGASTRAGTAIVGRCKQPFGTPPRNIDFIYAQLQAYTLEFGNQYMRVIMNGGYVLEPALNVTAATAANPAVFTSAAHGLAVGDWLFAASFTGAGWVGFNSTAGFIMLVASTPTANTFTCTDLDGNVISSAGFGAYPGGGTVARLFTLTTPYAVADLPLLKYTQSADVLTLTHPSYAPRDLTRSAHYIWTLSTITFAAAVQVPTGAAATSSGAGALDFYYKVTSVTDDPAEESVATAAFMVNGPALNQTTGVNNNLTWVAPATGPTPSRYNVYAARAQTAGATAPTIFGYIGQTTSLQFRDTNIAPDFTQVPPTARNPFAAGVNPSCADYFQGRKVFAGPTAFPNTIYTSQSGNFRNMDTHIPSQDSDAITVTLNARQVNAIKHLISLNSLLALTSSGAWQISGGTASDVITPASTVAQPQAYNGVSDVPPLTINYDILYVQARGSKVRDLAYNFYVNLYTGNDVSVLASHLFFGYTIREWCYAEEPYYQIAAVRDDGKLLIFTYLKEQDVYAWSQHDTQGQFISVCSIPEGIENAIYAIAARAIPGVNGGAPVYYQERIASRNFYLAGNPDPALAWCLDSAVRYGPTPMAGTLQPGSGAETRGTTDVAFTSSAGVFTAPMVGRIIKANTGLAEITAVDSANVARATILSAFATVPNVTPAVCQLVAAGSLGAAGGLPISGWFCTAKISELTGLEHLNGKSIELLVDGGKQPAQTVANGRVSLQEPGSIVLGGLPYDCDLQTLRIDVGMLPGGGTIQNKRKKIGRLGLIVQDTRGLKGAPMRADGTFAAADLREIKERGNQPYGSPIPLTTGIQSLILLPQWQLDGCMWIQATPGLPATVLALIPEVVVGDDPG